MVWIIIFENIIAIWSGWNDCQVKAGTCGNGMMGRYHIKCSDGSNSTLCKQFQMQACYKSCQGQFKEIHKIFDDCSYISCKYDIQKGFCMDVVTFRLP